MFFSSLRALYTMNLLVHDSPEPQSFEHTFQTSYSHGLEFIYALENVDLKSVRRLNNPSDSSKEKKTVVRPIFRLIDSPQLKFDFGQAYKTTIDSFIFDEPIRVLEISKMAEKGLLENDKKKLRDLIEANLNEFVFFKGMGQGHIDEIAHKLSKYIDNRPLKNCMSIDIISWIRSLVCDLDRKKNYVLMEVYQLADHFSLTPAESVEVRRLSLEKRQEWNQSTINELCLDNKRKSVTANAEKIVDIFIKPWMNKRYGYATGQEIVERIDQIIENKSCSETAMNFLSKIYFAGKCPFRSSLIQLEDGLYCVADRNADEYEKIIKRAETYFYHKNISYKFSMFVNLLSREFAKEWQGFHDGVIEKILRLSSIFRVRKGDDHQLYIKKS